MTKAVIKNIMKLLEISCKGKNPCTYYYRVLGPLKHFLSVSSAHVRCASFDGNLNSISQKCSCPVSTVHVRKSASAVVCPFNISIFISICICILKSPSAFTANANNAKSWLISLSKLHGHGRRARGGRC